MPKRKQDQTIANHGTGPGPAGGPGARRAPGTKGGFEISIDDIDGRFDAAVVARMQVVNVERLVVRRGADAAAILERADAVARAVIEDNLHDGDAYVESAPGVYGLLFSDTTTSAAELKRSAISDQIARSIKGRGDDRAGAAPERPTRDAGSTRSSLRRMARTRVHASGAVKSELEWAPLGAPGAARDLPEEPTAVFRPVWNVRNKLLSAYLASAVVRRPASAVDEAWWASADIDDAAGARAAVDDFIQDAALSRLHPLVDAGHPVLMILPVHFLTIDRFDYSAPYLQRLRKLPDRERRLIVLELLATPKDLPAGRVKDVVGRMRQAVRSVLARVPPGETSMAHWKKAGVHAVGFDSVEYPVPEKSHFKAWDRFTARAETCGLGKYIHGLSTRSMATAAVAAGFDYVEGAGIRPAGDTPEYVRSFESQDLFTELLGAGTGHPSPK